MSRSLAFSTRPSGPTADRTASTSQEGTSSQRPVGVRLPADDARRGYPARMPSASRMRGSGSLLWRGWSGRLRSWNQVRRRGSGAAPPRPQSSLPSRIAGSAASADVPMISSASSKRGSKPRQPGEVGAVLAVGPDEDAVVASGRAHARGDAAARARYTRRRDERLRLRHAEVGQRDARESRPGHGSPLLAVHAPPLTRSSSVHRAVSRSMSYHQFPSGRQPLADRRRPAT